MKMNLTERWQTLQAAEAQLKAEREKVRVLRDAASLALSYRTYMHPGDAQILVDALQATAQEDK